MDQARNLKLADGYWQSESWKRVFFDKVAHYKTNAQLAAEYEQRFGKKPAGLAANSFMFSSAAKR